MGWENPVIFIVRFWMWRVYWGLLWQSCGFFLPRRQNGSIPLTNRSHPQWGGSTCITKNLLSSRETAPNPHIILSSVPSYPAYTAVEHDLGRQYQTMVAEYARCQYRGLVNMSKYGIFSGEPPQGKNEVKYDQWICEVEDSQKTYGKGPGEGVHNSLPQGKSGSYHPLFRA